jgi:hypothetical protein
VRNRRQHAIRFRTSPNSGKEDLYLIQDRISIAFLDHMIIAGEFDILGSANARVAGAGIRFEPRGNHILKYDRSAQSATGVKRCAAN